jgi:hypothetical protein
MKKSSLSLATFLLLSIFSSCFAETNNSGLVPAKDFLQTLRLSYKVGMWADMRGNINHKRRLQTGEYETKAAKIKMSFLYTKLQAVAMIKLAENDLNSESSEIYKVGQSYNGAPASVIASNLQDVSMIGDFGITPEDFTMTFLFWDLANVNQDQTDSVKGLKCRILNLMNPKTKEKVKVYASIDYICPLKVEWFKPDQNSPYRTMVIEAFKLKGDLGAPNEILITGPGWKTKINFDEIKLGYRKITSSSDKVVKPGIPKDLFM